MPTLFVKTSGCLASSNFHWIICINEFLFIDDGFASLSDSYSFNIQLFLIEGDYIQLREGAQKMVAATAAVAKVAAAAAASTPYSSYMSTVAVTPMAQTHRMKKAPSIDSKNIKSEYAVIS